MPPSSDRKNILLVTGMLGAGKTTASDTLEDTGFFCVDNLPVSLIAQLVEFSLAAGGQQRHLGLVATVRDAFQLAELALGQERERILDVGRAGRVVAQLIGVMVAELEPIAGQASVRAAVVQADAAVTIEAASLQVIQGLHRRR